MIRLTGFLAAFALVTVIVPTWAAAPDPAAGELVERYVTAVNARDTARLKALIHPGSAACMSESNTDFYDYVLGNDLDNTIPPAYELAVNPVGAGEPLIMEGMLAYPVRPSHVFQIEYETGANSGTTIVRYVVNEGGAWSTVIGCPNEAALEMFRQARVRVREYEEQTRALVAALEEPLRSEIKALIEKGNRIVAVKLYGDATGEDLTTSHSVVKMIESEGR